MKKLIPGMTHAHTHRNHAMPAVDVPKISLAQENGTQPRRRLANEQ